MKIKKDFSLAQDLIPHDVAKDFLLGKRGTPCREQLESLIQYSTYCKPVV